MSPFAYNAGFDAMPVGYKNGRQYAVVMINRNNNGRFIEQVLESVAREDKWPDYSTWESQLEYEPVSPQFSQHTQERMRLWAR